MDVFLFLMVDFMSIAVCACIALSSMMAYAALVRALCEARAHKNVLEEEERVTRPHKPISNSILGRKYEMYYNNNYYFEHPPREPRTYSD